MACSLASLWANAMAQKKDFATVGSWSVHMLAAKTAFAMVCSSLAPEMALRSGRE